MQTVFGKINYGGLKHNSLYLGLVLPSGGWQSLNGSLNQPCDFQLMHLCIGSLLSLWCYLSYEALWGLSFLFNRLEVKGISEEHKKISHIHKWMDGWTQKLNNFKWNERILMIFSRPVQLCTSYILGGGVVSDQLASRVRPPYNRILRTFWSEATGAWGPQKIWGLLRCRAPTNEWVQWRSYTNFGICNFLIE